MTLPDEVIITAGEALADRLERRAKRNKDAEAKDMNRREAQIVRALVAALRQRADLERG